MLRIVNGLSDLKGFDREHFYNIYRVELEHDYVLAAIASTLEEANDAVEMLQDLTHGQYYISAPKLNSN
jgi:hypothetical protein